MADRKSVILKYLFEELETVCAEDAICTTGVFADASGDVEINFEVDAAGSFVQRASWEGSLERNMVSKRKQHVFNTHQQEQGMKASTYLNSTGENAQRSGRQ